MSDFRFSNSMQPDEMGEYLQLYLDETEEQLDSLVEVFLHLEQNPTEPEGLREAFRLVHSIKGSSALLGFDEITALTHFLETHFDRLRAGERLLDTATINVVLRAIDFLRESAAKLRAGGELPRAGSLLDEVKALEGSSLAESDPPQPDGDRAWHVVVELERGLPMAGMKAELILTRLTKLGRLTDCQPPRESLGGLDLLDHFEFVLLTAASESEIRTTAGADGVADLQLKPTDAAEAVAESPAISAEVAEHHVQAVPRPAAVAETVRVDVERLDLLLNQTGELVTSRARLAQLTDQLSALFRKDRRAEAFISLVEGLRGLHCRLASGELADGVQGLEELASQLEALESRLHDWDAGRQTYSELVEAVDRLGQVANTLQRSMLGTRMVPVGPLFGRFKRSVRDIAAELGKQVQFELHGESTELDKRMIDEIGDPLNHLIRNCIDHGVESAADRLRQGKPQDAMIRLSASHRGSNVFITVEDDGRGVDTNRVKRLAIERGLLSRETADSLSENDLVELIFHPGFSTAEAVSGLSGRGVGMDIVRTKIARLNGGIEVDSTRGVGTRFTIRLPLTLTITRCMLFQMAHGVLAIPIDQVREIAPLDGQRRIIVGGREMCDIRNELIPLTTVDELFDWPRAAVPSDLPLHLVVLQANGRFLGLVVESLLGGQDLVVKSLDENFIHIRGLGGASILGDGSVCLLLDVATCMELAGGAPVTADVFVEQ